MKIILILAITFCIYVSVSAQTNLFPSSGNVGIGTSSPGSKLEVVGQINSKYNSTDEYWFRHTDLNNSIIAGFKRQGNDLLIRAFDGIKLAVGNTENAALAITPSGNIGIGTLNPGSPLSISGNGTGVSVSPGGAPYYGTLAFNRESATGTIFDPSGSAFQINNGGTDANLHFTVWNGNGTMVTSNALVIGADGNVGIGVSNSKGYKLAVAGNMIAESVKVQLQSAWPDYVFANDYTLPSLKETEKHIKENNHLPGIPSAAEVKTNGIDVGEMNAKLLQKIEELTLYVIDLNKKSSSQEIMVKKLQNEVKKLKSKK